MTFEEWYDSSDYKLDHDFGFGQAAWTAALAAARKYMEHLDACMAKYGGNYPCTCGLAALLKEADAEGEKEGAIDGKS